MKPVVFVTANKTKHDEVQRLLAGLDVRWERLDLARPDTGDLEAIARARVVEAYRRLGEPCFLENTGLYLWEHDGAPGASFKKTWRELGEAGFAARYGGSRGIARVVVALAESADPADARLFTGSIAGELLGAPRGPAGFGWDRLWVPDGYDRTLGEMAGSTYVVNMRAQPYLELGEHLRGHTAPGTFEAHVTVKADDAPHDLDAFRAACTELGVKCISIELPEGETRAQPMTGSFHRGALLDVQREVVALAGELVRRGFTVTRTKIEAHGRLDWTPATDEEAARGPSTSYFELHMKLALPADADLTPLVRRFKELGAHLSRNAHKQAGSDGMAEHFVTVRAHRVGRITAEARFAAFCAEVEAGGYAVRNRIREYTVFDTNVALDRGWIDP
jgi:inosine/xanthosine triphosphate pyrophosphatase family protein